MIPRNALVASGQVAKNLKKEYQYPKHLCGIGDCQTDCFRHKKKKDDLQKFVLKFNVEKEGDVMKECRCPHWFPQLRPDQPWKKYNPGCSRKII